MRDQGVMGGAPRHLPEAVMGREIAIVLAQVAQATAHESEVLGLLRRHLHPIVVVGTAAGPRNRYTASQARLMALNSMWATAWIRAARPGGLVSLRWVN